MDHQAKYRLCSPSLAYGTRGFSGPIRQSASKRRGFAKDDERPCDEATCQCSHSGPQSTTRDTLQKLDYDMSDASDEEEDRFLPEDEEDSNLSPEVKELMRRLELSKRKDESREVEEPTCTKVNICP